LFRQITIVLGILVVLSVLILFFKRNSERFVQYMLMEIRRINQVNDPLKSLIFIGIQIVFQLFFLPM
jgi:hypothetical protein